MYLITGAAGFIGFHTAQALLAQGLPVIGLDNLSSYYDTALKESRLELLKKNTNFTFIRADISDYNSMQDLLGKYLGSITHVIHLAAQAGVRHSIDFPFEYLQANVVGQVAMLELCCRLPALRNMVYASSSSVYGANETLPFANDQRTDHPISIYGASKKAAEIFAESYVRLYDLPITGLRFFTVYGPWGRPDMAYFSFTKKILAGQDLRIFDHGQMQRDFTYIDDITTGILGAVHTYPKSKNGHPIYNLGSGRRETLEDFVQCLEEATGKKAIRDYMPIQPGDMKETCADISASQKDFGFSPKVTMREGLHLFVHWYKNFYHVGST